MSQGSGCEPGTPRRTQALAPMNRGVWKRTEGLKWGRFEYRWNNVFGWEDMSQDRTKLSNAMVFGGAEFPGILVKEQNFLRKTNSDLHILSKNNPRIDFRFGIKLFCKMSAGKVLGCLQGNFWCLRGNQFSSPWGFQFLKTQHFYPYVSQNCRLLNFSTFLYPWLVELNEFELKHLL